MNNDKVEQAWSTLFAFWLEFKSCSQQKQAILRIHLHLHRPDGAMDKAIMRIAAFTQPLGNFAWTDLYIQWVETHWIYKSVQVLIT